MGLFEKLFKRKDPPFIGYFQLLDGYTPSYTTYDGGVYEMELTRACIHAFANHSSKLSPMVVGSARKDLQKMFKTKPNIFMTTSQFIYKCATIHDTQNTLFIIPILDDYDKLVGYYPVMSSQVEVLEYQGEPWLRYTFPDGKRGAMELARCGVTSKYLYKKDIKGESNRAIAATMQLIDLQNQGIGEGIRNSSSFKFYARVSNFSKSDDLAKERKRFSAKNFGPDAEGGAVLLFPNTYDNIGQVTTAAQVVDPEQMSIIQDRVFNYFGCNEEILQNKAIGDAWAAYYEGKIEPFAIQLSEALTAMTFTEHEIAHGNEIVFSSNRLQYMANKDKAEVSASMFDRGVFTVNMIMDIWNLPHVPDGDKRYIRKEYIDIAELGKKPEEPPVIITAPGAEPAAEPAASPQEPVDPNKKEDNNDPEGQIQV